MAKHSWAAAAANLVANVKGDPNRRQAEANLLDPNGGYASTVGGVASQTKTVNPDGSYDVAHSGVTGAAYSSYTVEHGTDGKPQSATYSNGMTAAWTYNADGSSHDVVRSNVPGLGYASYESLFDATDASLLQARDMNDGSGALLLRADGLTIDSGPTQLSATSGADTFTLTPHASELIHAGGRSAETFAYHSGFGQGSISGLLASGTSNDVIQFDLTMFNGLSPTNTPAEDWTALLSSGAAVQSGKNVIITDNADDTLALNNVTTSMLTKYASSDFKFA